MKSTVYLHDFREAFRQADRKTHFSYDGLEILFDYLEELERDMGEEIELDVIALCCDYAEASPEEIADYYSIDTKGLSEDEIPYRVQEFLEEKGVFVGATDHGQFIYRQF